MKLRKTLRIGGLALKFEVDKTVERLFLQSLDFFSNPSKGKPIITFKVFMKAIGESGPFLEKAPSDLLNIAKKYISSLKKIDHYSARDKRCIIDAFKLWGRSAFLRHFFEGKALSRIDNFQFYAADSSRMLIIDYSKREIFILTAKIPFKELLEIVRHFMFFIISSLAPLAESFVLHSSGVSIGNTGYLFAGKSGSGKTTITKKIKKCCPASSLISDDHLLISTKGKDIRAYRLPVFNKKEGFDKFKMSAQVKKIFILKKAFKNKVLKVRLKNINNVLLTQCQQKNSCYGSKSQKVLPYIIKKALQKTEYEELYFNKNIDISKSLLK